MKRLLITCAAIAATLCAPALASAQGRAAQDLLVPITGTGVGSIFTGTLDINRFAMTDQGLVAIGTVTGTLVDTAGNVTTFVRNVSIPTAVAETSCAILNLDLGPLDLNLLGLTVHLNEVVLDIEAVPGAGNLLGNLLCAVAGLLDSPGGLTRVLNEILGIIG